jgi:phosphoglycerate dehydrogenase-like enzyme
VKVLIQADLAQAIRDRVPDDTRVSVYDGEPTPPPLDEVEFYVPPYMSGNEVFRLMTQMPRLKVVQTLTAGVDDVLPYLPDGVVLCNARGLHDASASELVVLLALGSLRGLPDFVRAQDAAAWRPARRDTLADRTVLIVGYGSIGKAIESRLAGFECEVLRVARTAREGIAQRSDLAGLLPAADVVVVTVPMTEDSKGLVDAAFLARMKDGALLINVSRGPVVDTAALLTELASGRIRAALDVTDPEPLPPSHPLWRAPGLLITPHIGGNTTAMLPRAVRLVAAQLRRYTAGEPLEHVVAGAY